MKKRKTYSGPIELKEDGPDGAFRSVFATFNVVDHDGDVTIPGAFKDGQAAVVEGWNHDYGLPPGKGVIHADDEKAWIDGQFFLDTTAGKDHYRTLKALDGLEEWSYTFDIEEAEYGVFEEKEVRYLKGMDVWGVAPVTRGAGIDTRTLSLKSADLTADEIQQIKALLKERAEGSGQDDGEPGGDSGDESGEGEAGADGAGKPSGVSPSVVLALIDNSVEE